MTTIAYSPAHRALAADSQATFHTTPVKLTRQKIIPIRRGDRRMLVCLSGTPEHAVTLIENYLDGTRYLGLRSAPAGASDCQATVMIVELFDTDHVVYHVNTHGNETDVTNMPWAIGSGCDYAIGAMAHGARPEEAIDIAARFDIYTGGPIQFESLDAWKSRPADMFHSFQPGPSHKLWGRASAEAHRRPKPGRGWLDPNRPDQGRSPQAGDLEKCLTNPRSPGVLMNLEPVHEAVTMAKEAGAAPIVADDTPLAVQLSQDEE